MSSPETQSIQNAPLPLAIGTSAARAPSDAAILGHLLGSMSSLCGTTVSYSRSTAPAAHRATSSNTSDEEEIILPITADATGISSDSYANELSLTTLYATKAAQREALARQQTLAASVMEELTTLTQHNSHPALMASIKQALHNAMPALEETLQQIKQAMQSSTTSTESVSDTTSNDSSSFSEWDFIQGIASMMGSINSSEANYNNTMFEINEAQNKAAIATADHMEHIMHHMIHKMHRLHKKSKDAKMWGDVAKWSMVAVAGLMVVASGGALAPCAFLAISLIMATGLFDMAAEGLATGLSELIPGISDATAKVLAMAIIITVLAVGGGVLAGYIGAEAGAEAAADTSAEAGAETGAEAGATSASTTASTSSASSAATAGTTSTEATAAASAQSFSWQSFRIVVSQVLALSSAELVGASFKASHNHDAALQLGLTIAIGVALMCVGGYESISSVSEASTDAEVSAIMQRIQSIATTVAMALGAATAGVNIGIGVNSLQRAEIEASIAQKQAHYTFDEGMMKLWQSLSDNTNSEVNAVDQGFITTNANMASVADQFNYLAMLAQAF